MMRAWLERIIESHNAKNIDDIKFDIVPQGSKRRSVKSKRISEGEREVKTPYKRHNVQHDNQQNLQGNKTNAFLAHRFAFRFMILHYGAAASALLRSVRV